MLKLENIIKNYDLDQNAKVEALKGINLVFNDKDFVSILGPSGCGKTTLLNIIGGLDHYTDGDLIIDDISTKNYKDIDWDIYRNNRIGFVFQSYNLIPHLTLLENVEMPLILNGIDKKTRVEKATKALERVGLLKEKNKKPNQLSGGQMQRVAIARALVNDPEIILADEPTGALDSETSVVVLDLLKEISKDKLVIMVTHNEKLAYLYSTRVITMLDGNVTSDKRISEEKEKESSYSFEEAKLNKTSMSFMTSFKLSIKNILTKKGRTILTAVASSVGIIGVGLVLAISNGFNDYITRVEEATASNSPITISSVSYSYSRNGEYDQLKFFHYSFPFLLHKILRQILLLLRYMDLLKRTVRLHLFDLRMRMHPSIFRHNHYLPSRKVLHQENTKIPMNKPLDRSLFL